MKIADHVKRQAMDAVSSEETVAMMRAIKNNGIEVSHASLFTPAPYARPDEYVHPIPEHVKRAALDAVSSKETTAVMWATKNNGIEVSHGELFAARPSDAPVRPIPEHVKRAALDAIAHHQPIRFAHDNGDVRAPLTPMRGTRRIAEQVARMHRWGHNPHFIHKTMTKDEYAVR